MNVILIQARMSSTRFPGKMLQKLGSSTLVEYVYKRCVTSSEAETVCIVTSEDKTDDALHRLCLEKKIPVCRGDLHNVLKRYITCAEALKASVICRVCGDSPFVDIEAIDEGFKHLKGNPQLEYLYTDNILNGFMSEVFTLEVLKRVHTLDLSESDKEHVTKYMRDNINEFYTECLNLELRPKGLSDYTLTIDYEADLKLAQEINTHLKGFNFKSDDIIKILNQMKDCV
jgi:spore coat polysaccharide biosynthesis protein SpsF